MNHLKEPWPSPSLAELMRASLLKEKILFLAVDSAMRGPMIDLAGILKELNAIDRHINQITHAFAADS